MKVAIVTNCLTADGSKLCKELVALGYPIMGISDDYRDEFISEFEVSEQSMFIISNICSKRTWRQLLSYDVAAVFHVNPSNRSACVGKVVGEIAPGTMVIEVAGGEDIDLASILGDSNEETPVEKEVCKKVFYSVPLGYAKKHDNTSSVEYPESTTESTTKSQTKSGGGPMTGGVLRGKKSKKKGN